MDTKAAVRVYPAAVPVKVVTRPVVGFPVRVEADNDVASDTLELWVEPAETKSNAKVETQREVVRPGGTREERVWLDPTGPGDALTQYQQADKLVPNNAAIEIKCEQIHEEYQE